MENTLNNNERKGGLYDKVNMSVNTANRIVIVMSILFVLALVFVINNNGFTVKFDTVGGTHVETQKLMYDDIVIVENVPTREGYEFAGWYRDENYTIPWNIESDKVSESMTLYAKWVEK